MALCALKPEEAVSFLAFQKTLISPTRNACFYKCAVSPGPRVHFVDTAVVKNHPKLTLAGEPVGLNKAPKNGPLTGPLKTALKKDL